MQTQEKTATEPEYTKEQIKQAGLFADTTDKAIVNVALDNDKKYTIAEAKKAIEDFRGGI